MKQAMPLEQESKVDFKPICPIAQGVAYSGDECEHADLATGYSFCAHRESRQLENSSSGEYAGNYRKRLGAADAAETLS